MVPIFSITPLFTFSGFESSARLIIPLQADR